MAIAGATRRAGLGANVEVNALPTLAPQALQPPKARREFRNRVPLLHLKPGSGPVTPERLNPLREEMQ